MVSKIKKTDKNKNSLIVKTLKKILISFTRTTLKSSHQIVWQCEKITDILLQRTTRVNEDVRILLNNVQEYIINSKEIVEYFNISEYQNTEMREMKITINCNNSRTPRVQVQLKNCSRKCLCEKFK